VELCLRFVFANPALVHRNDDAASCENATLDLPVDLGRACEAVEAHADDPCRLPALNEFPGAPQPWPLRKRPCARYVELFEDEFIGERVPVGADPPAHTVELQFLADEAVAAPTSDSRDANNADKRLHTS
jgi:hypothetical protein